MPSLSTSLASLLLLLVVILHPSCSGFQIQPPAQILANGHMAQYEVSSYRYPYNSQVLHMARRGSSKGNNDDEQAREALQSLGDFHQGSWTGQATSFTVTADVAAGIVQKKTSPPYQLSVKLGYNPSGKLSINEMFSWLDGGDLSYACSRSVSLKNSSVDCDSVDASYSLDVTNQQLPVDIIGTSKDTSFCVEHTLAVSDNARIRLWALYGTERNLIRIVVCNEARADNSEMETAADTMSLSATDLMDLQNDVDRIVDKIAGHMQGSSSIIATPSNESTTAETNTLEKDKKRLKKLQEKLSESAATSSSACTVTASNEDRGLPLKQYPMTLLEMTSGVWLGDSIIRDFSMISGNKGKQESFGNKGFGVSSSTNNQQPAFASWAVGVQKVAREWLWDFGEMIRQNNEAGKAVGVAMEPALSPSMGGTVCENKFMSRRITKEDRMVYIDWNDGNGDSNVGFLLGSVSIQVPRFAIFGGRQTKPFYTELCVYQRMEDNKAETSASVATNVDDDDVDMDNVSLPEVVCSRICRLYNSEGQLKQGCTSFYTLKRFGQDDDV